MPDVTPTDWKTWVRSQVRIERLTIRGPAEQASDLIRDCSNDNWQVSMIVYETIAGHSWVRFIAEKEIPRAN